MTIEQALSLLKSLKGFLSATSYMAVEMAIEALEKEDEMKDIVAGGLGDMDCVDAMHMLKELKRIIER